MPRVNEYEDIPYYVMEAHKQASLTGHTAKVEVEVQTGKIGEVSIYPDASSSMGGHKTIYECSHYDWMHGHELHAYITNSGKYILPTKNTVFEGLGIQAGPERAKEYGIDIHEEPRLMTEEEIYKALDWRDILSEDIEMAQFDYVGMYEE